MSPALLLALALQAAAPTAPDDAPQLAELKRAWQESCADRAYGTFDDVCTQMSDQIRAYERESRKAARKAPSPGLPVSPAPAAGPPSSSVPAQASALTR